MKVPKLIPKILAASIFMSGIVVQALAQIVLPEITKTVANYKYLNASAPR